MPILFQDLFDRDTSEPDLSLVFEDTFTRSVTGGIGNAGVYTLIASQAPAPNVNGSELVLPATSWNQWDWTSGMTQAKGQYEFDFYVGSVVEDFGYFYQVRSDNYADGQISIAVFADEGPDWVIFAGSLSATWQPDASTWYSVKVIYDPEGATQAKIWERGTTEPDWMWLEASSPGLGSTIERVQLFGGDDDIAMFDNLRVYEVDSIGGIGDIVNYTYVSGVSEVVNNNLRVPADQSAEWEWNAAPPEHVAVYKFDFYVPIASGIIGDFFGSYRITGNSGGLWFQVASGGLSWNLNVGTGDVDWTAQDDTWYTAKIEWQPTQIRVRIWDRTQPEPSTWLYDETTSFLSTEPTLLVAGGDGVDALFDNFIVSTLTSADPLPPVGPNALVRKRSTISMVGRRNKQQILKDFIRPSPVSAPAPNTGSSFTPGSTGTGGCGGLGQTISDGITAPLETLVRSMDGTYYQPSSSDVSYYLEVFFDGVKAIPFTDYRIEGNRVYPTGSLSADVEVTAQFVRG